MTTAGLGIGIFDAWWETALASTSAAAVWGNVPV
jgi:hypothetical protein